MGTITFDCQQLQGSIDDLLSHVQEHLDVNRLIIDLRTLLFSSIEELIVAVLENLFENPCFLGTVKMLAAKCGLRFKEFKTTSIRLLSGRSMPILSPYFAKAKPKSRRGRLRERQKKKGRPPEKPRRRGYHANWREPIQIVIGLDPNFAHL